ncbi:hypothetical protein [Paenibacillus rigui]|uniref:DUF4190 domain-containing protein n=1 Tax=Paenibacillus rigui TaxID=554312 RepID=A0A229UR82_9BACL|nr:hypothetical protein [Paenibacillus rigui]OXM86087.1 hypothetical protein CF651_12780 [Paenibacillus rigui]
MKDQKHWEAEVKPKEPKRYPMDQLRKETGQEVNEEYAAEVSVPYAAPKQAPVETSLPVRKSDSVADTQAAGGIATGWVGYTAILVSVISLFIYPVLFGAAGAFLGFIAYAQGQKALGAWSVILGLVSLAGYFLLVPLYS